MNLYEVRKEINSGMPITNIKLRVTDYSRVSTDNLGQKKSLQNQVEHFTDFIKSNSNWVYVKGYVDEGITGTNASKREQFMQMIADAKAGAFDLIVTKEISRFSRNTLDSIKYTRELLDYGVAVLFYNDNINTAMPDSELRLTIMASMAQDEIRRLSERVKFGMNRAIAKGEILGNDLLYGYKKNKITGSLEIIPSEAELVARLYRLFTTEAQSLSKIAKIFNYENIRTKQGKRWNPSTLSRMITNPKYKGYYCANKTKTIDHLTKKVKYLAPSEWKLYQDTSKIPPIVSEDLWQKANFRLALRKKAYLQRVNNKEIYKNRYLYSAKIFCAKDNQIFHRRRFCKSKEDYSWVCSQYLKYGKKTCASPSIRESELHTIFKDLISLLFNDKAELLNMILSLYKKSENKSGFQTQINKLKENKLLINYKQDKLLELSIDNSITNAEFRQKNKELRAQLRSLDKEIEHLQKQKADYIQGTDQKAKLAAVIKAKLDSQAINTKIISLLLNQIIVTKLTDELELKIFFAPPSFSVSAKDSQDFRQIIDKSYEFKRGYDTTGTKRYLMKYKVICYLHSQVLLKEKVLINE